MFKLRGNASGEWRTPVKFLFVLRPCFRGGNILRFGWTNMDDISDTLTLQRHPVLLP